ncbi:MAG: general secretion pathway protein [Betaproteobacteria bacterium]|nr:general secretion pathway protein [Betaproteobacteria bacterium]
MQLSIGSTEFAQTAVIAVVTIAALALLGLVGGYWTWQWLAPRPEPHVQARAEPSGQIASALELFGSIQRDGNAPAPTGIAIRLLGVVAAMEGRDGYAIVVLDGRQIVATREGQDIAPGIRLAEVATNHVVLDRNGVREALAWPEKTPAAEPAAQRTNR